MIVHRDKSSKGVRRGRGLLNKVINNLPFESHLPGYQYCGLGTKLAKRLARGDPEINPLDTACKEHDIAYSKTRENVEARNVDDRILAEKAGKRVFGKVAGIGEKAAAWGQKIVIKVKSKFGMGLKAKKPATTLRKIVAAAKKSMVPSNDAQTVIKSALRGAREAVKKAGGKRNIIKPRILPVPKKVGGFLPLLIPIFSGLSATGALAGGAAGIAKAVNDSNAAKRQLWEKAFI